MKDYTNYKNCVDEVKDKNGKVIKYHDVCKTSRGEMLLIGFGVNHHHTQKPVGLFEYLVKTYSQEGNTVLDCCMGSGTTAVACLNTHRNFIGFELDKEYYEKSIERIEIAKKTKKKSE